MLSTTARRAALGILCGLCACTETAPTRVIDETSRAPEVPAAPRALIGTWRATTLNGVALPALFRTGVVADSGTAMVARFVFVDSAEVSLHADGHFTQAVYYTEWAGKVNGGASRALYTDVAVDAGRWESTSAGAVHLQSIWLAGRRISGTIVGATPQILRLQHGISVGPIEATFEYRR